MFTAIRRFILRGRTLDRRAPQKFRPRLQSLEERAVPSRTILVDDDRAQFRNAAFTTIQAAVDAAQSGDTISVARGTYREQVIIPSRLVGLKLLSAGGFRTIIQAPTTFGDGSGAIIHVNGGTFATIRGFTITGPQGGSETLVFGVLVDNNGSADVSFNRIVSIRSNPLSGNQDGVGIQIGQVGDAAVGPTGRGVATIVGNTITDYQKGGIVVGGLGSNADVRSNTIRGVGQTGVIAQNGIQISDGAGGRVRFNTVSGNSFTGPDAEGVGILVFNTGFVQVESNTTTGNDEGILVDDSSQVSVRFNTSNRNFFNGIGVLGGSGNLVSFNTTRSNVFDGINLEDTTANLIERNNASNNGRDGIALEATATGNLIRRNTARNNVRFDLSDASAGANGNLTANFFDHNSARKLGRPTA
jgi:parallel beta-helix repeat protein